MWKVWLTGPSLPHRADAVSVRSFSAASAATLVVAPTGDEALAAATPSVVPTTAVVGGRHGHGRAGGSHREPPPRTTGPGHRDGAPWVRDQALEVLLGDRHAGRGSGTGRGDDVVARGRLDGAMSRPASRSWRSIVRRWCGRARVTTVPLSPANGPCGPSGQVVLVVGRRVDLEDDRDVVDVDAAGRDVGRDEHREGAVTEGAEHAVARPG